jgi:hypothetical protein
MAFEAVHRSRCGRSLGREHQQDDAAIRRVDVADHDPVGHRVLILRARLGRARGL